MKTVLFFHTSRRQSWQKERDGAFRFARTRGWRIQIVEPSQKKPHVHELIDLWNPIGCIVECSGEASDYFDDADFADLPTVFLGRDPRTLSEQASFINPSPKGPGAIAAKELLKAGLSSFAFIAMAGDQFWSRDREAEFRQILRLHGMDCAVLGRTDTFKSEKTRVRAFNAFLKALPKPCGILAENDYAAVYVLDLAGKLGISVPSQLSVIGIDNDPLLCANARPVLSSVYLDFEQAGYRACEILAQLVDNASSGPIRETYGALGLIHRGSTPSGTGTPPRVEAMLSFIRQHACDGISAADVARRIKGSRRLAQMDFLKATGRTIKDEINRIRFERVEILLKSPSQQLDAIAGLCGWKSGNALRSAFLKRYGLSMREWRKAYR